MLATEAARLKRSDCPLLLGSLWYDIRLDVLWQVVHIYGNQHRADLAIVELGGFITTGTGPYWARRRMQLPQLVDRYCFFGSIHDKTWES